MASIRYSDRNITPAWYMPMSTHRPLPVRFRYRSADPMASIALHVDRKSTKERPALDGSSPG